MAEQRPTVEPDPKILLKSKLSLSSRFDLRFDHLFKIAIDGQPYTAITDGRIAFAIKADIEGSTEEPLGQQIQKFLTEPLPHSSEATTAELKALVTLSVKPCKNCDGTAEPFPCAECHGSGVTDCRCRCGDHHVATCVHCDGEKIIRCTCVRGQIVKIWSPYRHASVLLGKAPTSPVLIWKALDGVPDGAVKVEFSDDLKKFVRLKADGWLAIIMPVVL